MKKLKFSEKHKVKYCIPDWLRDEQIKLNTQRVKGRIEPVDVPRSEAVAIVGYGPSLNDTWEEIRKFKFVVSCSGSHKFLVDRGIIPTWHVEVDPREHKVRLIGQPQRETEYLIASTCHPKVLTHLEGFNVKLWHVFDSTEQGKRLLPHGDWAVTGGCDVGMRAMALAAFMGFRDLHCFGIDGCARDSKHASDHPLAIKDGFSECEYPEGSGKTYRTTAGLLEAAKQVFYELDQLPRVRATFHGEGLVQDMAKAYKPKEDNWVVDQPFSNLIGSRKQHLISSEYRGLNNRLHTENLAYGVGGGKHAPRILKLVEQLKTHSVLDYGCGKGYLAKELSFPIWEYDPAIPGKDETPRPADIVACTDVLEHIEPERLDYVLYDLQRCVKKVGYFTIHTGPSGKTLADGRNSHLIQENWDWWKARLLEYFDIVQHMESAPIIYVIVAAKRQARVSARAA